GVGAAGGAGATTWLDTGWAPAGEWSAAKAALSHADYLLPNAAECVRLAAALAAAAEPAITGSEPATVAEALKAAGALHDLGPDVAVKLGADGAPAVAAAR